MKALFSILPLLLSFTALGAQPGAVPSVTIAASTNAQNVALPLSMLSGVGVNSVFSLYAGGALTGSDFYKFYKNGTAYQVPATKNAYCFNLNASAASSGLYQLVSATATWSDGAASITGGVYQCGTSSSSNCQIPQGATQNAMTGTYIFSALTFPGVEANNTQNYTFQMSCYEQ